MLPSHSPDRCRVCGSRDTSVDDLVSLIVSIWVHMRCGSCDATWTAFYEFDRSVLTSPVPTEEESN